MTTINTVPRFEVTINDGNLHESVRSILAQIRSDWISGDGKTHDEDDSINSKVLTGGITNKIIGFFHRDRANDMVIFKIYGVGTDTIIDREKEIQTMILLNKFHLGSKLFALFTNGIAYEYIPGTTLNMKSCHRPEVYSLVAAKMGRLHSVPLSGTQDGGDATTTKYVPLIWDMVDKFITLAAESFALDPKLELDFGAIGVTLDWARTGVAELRSICESESSMPIVFTHNDLLLGNIIYNGSSEVAFIDFEYSGPNYAPYDVANHFNEFAGVEPEEIDYGNYPNHELRSEWIRIYLQHLKLPGNVGGGLPFDQRTFEKWVSLCTPLSQLTWVVWCVVQAANSKLDFDYVQYARGRFPQYEKGMKIARELFL